MLILPLLLLLPLDDRTAWIEQAVQFLAARAEVYEADPPVGRLPDERLGSWQESEAVRLAELFDVEGGREWPYEGVYRVGRAGMIPSGYRVGGTSIVAEALLLAPGFDGDASRQELVQRALAFVLESLKEDPSLAPFSGRGTSDNAYDVRGWGHTYALSLLLRLEERKLVREGQQEAVQEKIQWLIEALRSGEGLGGGWNYATGKSASPFQTGATLLVLYRARAQGHLVPTEMVEHALEALARGRKEDSGAYSYSVSPKQKSHREALNASAARAAVAELALYLAGRSKPEDLLRAVEGFFFGWEDLLVRKSQQGTHEGPYAIAPYYFFFGHGYAGLAIEALPEAARPALRERLLERIAATREKDGSWNDRVFPRTASYGTAMVLLALLAQDLPSLPPWPALDESQGPPEDGGK